MNNNQLFKALEKVKYVYSKNFKFLRIIFDIVNKNPNTIIELDSRCYYFNIADFHHWSTYEDCVDFKFEANDKLTCAVYVYDGNMVDGQREKLRFLLKVELPLNFLKNIQENIQYELIEYYHQQYQDMLKKIETDWVNNKIQEFLEMN